MPLCCGNGQWLKLLIQAGASSATPRTHGFYHADIRTTRHKTRTGLVQEDWNDSQVGGGGAGATATWEAEAVVASRAVARSRAANILQQRGAWVSCACHHKQCWTLTSSAASSLWLQGRRSHYGHQPDLI